MGAECRHRYLVRSDLDAWADLLQAAHDHPVVGAQPFDDAQAVLLERARCEAAVLGLVLGVEDVDVLQALVRCDRAVDHQQRRVRLAHRQANANEHPRFQRTDAF
jgi:hypothetical protein